MKDYKKLYEDCKKQYEDLVNRIKTMAKAQPLVTKKAIEMHFPEIVESEDEKIRKAIIESLPKYGYLPQTNIKVEDATAWSEEDEEIINKISIAIAAIYSCSTAAKVEKWLKSLKERYTWKPSKEQIEALDIAIRCGIQLGTWEEESLKSLKEELRKLMNE